MNYVVDVNKPSVKQAISELGINLDQLALKDLEDFQEGDFENSISKLKFDYFKRKQQEFVRLITEKQKSYSAKIRKSTISSKTPVFLTQVTTAPSVQETQIKDLTRVKMLNSLKDIQRNMEATIGIDKKIENSREARQKYLSVKTVKRLMMEKFKEKQIENLEKIKKIEGKNKKKRRYETNTPKIRTNQSIDFFSREEPRNDSEADITECMKTFEDKMKKSEAIKSNFLKQKKLAISKLFEKENLRFKRKKNHSNSERLLKLIEKQEVMKERNRSLAGNKKLFNDQFSAKLRQRLEDAQKNYKKIQLELSRDKRINVRVAKSELVIKRNQEEWQRRLELKTELSRMKEENIQSEQERFLNIQKYRRKLILEKQFNDSERISKLSNLKKQKIENTFKSLYQGMIEKDKYKELISEALRSPQSKRFKQKMIELDQSL